MAIRYSNGYGQVPSADSTSAGAVVSSSSYVWKGLIAQQKGRVIEIAGQYDLANGNLNATDTQLFLCPLPQGGRLVGCQIAPSVDIDSGNTFTFNLGTVASATAYTPSPSTALQAVTGFSLPATIATDAAQQVAIGASESLILARAAGTTASTGTIYFTAKIALP